MSRDEDVATMGSEDEATPKPKKLPQSEVHFAFGPQNRYWVRCGESWRFVRSNKSDWSDISIQDPHWVAFKHNTGFLVGGWEQDAARKIYHSWNDGYNVINLDFGALSSSLVVKSREAYKKLHSWLDSKQLRDTCLSIGPKGSYFARCGSSWIAHALPKDLMDVLEREGDRTERSPITVALGIYGSWIVLWSDGETSYNLRHAYPSLASGDLLNGKTGQVVFVALNPYQEDRFFVTMENGTCSYKTSLPTKEDSKILHEITDNYMRMRAKREGETFSHSYQIDNQARNVTIKPDAYEDKATDTLLMALNKRRVVLMRRDNMALIGSVATGAGMISKITGASPLKAMGVATSAGLGVLVGLVCGTR
ncbi:hypothetical protein N0V90_010740 [Kalmusia sp. IMI 367209]|nr:hypothetical protein N0V90_010740 [Kalmusia sp. IMI 367209]